MLIPHPQDLLELMGSIPEGKVISATTLRACLAKTYGTEITCPMVTGIFMNVVAQAAEEDRAAGAAQITPYWRTLRANFELNPKYPWRPRRPPGPLGSRRAPRDYQRQAPLHCQRL